MISTVMRRAWLSLAVVGAVAGGLAACGPSGAPGGGAGTTDDARGAAAATRVTKALSGVREKTEKAGSARVDCTMSMGDTVATRSTGAIGWADGLSGTLTITYTGGSWAKTMRELGNVSTPARFVADAYYAKMSDKFAAVSGHGRHWIKYDYEASASFTPAQSVELLLAAPDTREVGTATVRGVRTTHYSGTVDVARLGTSRPGLTDTELAELTQWLKQAGITKERVDIWVDARGLLVERSERGEVTGGTSVTTAYYKDYGTRVRIPEPPPAADTVDFADLVNTKTS
ncbi:hypothetical protein [Streptomyces sp. NPDC058371]|jgi:hypothetical protein|uniref:hypothetical protein n=1 Tax=Streptomyces sp. NPDC058371 TaxID=3346463 RepID=UPI00364D4E62